MIVRRYGVSVSVLAVVVKAVVVVPGRTAAEARMGR